VPCLLTRPDKRAQKLDTEAAPRQGASRSSPREGSISRKPRLMRIDNSYQPRQAFATTVAACRDHVASDQHAFVYNRAMDVRGTTSVGCASTNKRAQRRKFMTNALSCSLTRLQRSQLIDLLMYQSILQCQFMQLRPRVVDDNGSASWPSGMVKRTATRG
jgi:hypothetical protein